MSIITRQRVQLACLLICVLVVGVSSVCLWLVDAPFFFAHLPRSVDPTAGAVFAILSSCVLCALSRLLLHGSPRSENTPHSETELSIFASSATTALGGCEQTSLEQEVDFPSLEPASETDAERQKPQLLWSGSSVLATLLAVGLCMAPLELLLGNAFVVTQRPPKVTVPFVLLLLFFFATWAVSVPWWRCADALRSALSQDRAHEEKVRRLALALSALLLFLSVLLLAVNMVIRADGRYYEGLGTLLALLPKRDERGFFDNQIADFVRGLDLLDALAALLQPMAGFFHGTVACALAFAGTLLGSQPDSPVLASLPVSISLLLMLLSLFLCAAVLASSLTVTLITFALDSIALAVPCLLLCALQSLLLLSLLWTLYILFRPHSQHGTEFVGLTQDDD
mmetsp:Transcript_8843/g.27400  ORF Transcript_8843/g.27400 Transcript_8843/m.27400 type:complete len:396 (-) Transcript_8843:24-1211(-)